jgi:ComF family protein
MLLKSFPSALLDMLYPPLCHICGNWLTPGYREVCLSCVTRLPQTDYHLFLENPFVERFWGRVPLVSAGAYLFFDKGSRAQELIHQLKYREQPNLGVWAGKRYGAMLKESSWFQTVDWIVPVPLHWKKKKSRGYNQSECFGKGLSEAMLVPQCTDLLYRKRFTETQTQKDRFERLANMESAFHLRTPERVRAKHLLLVDDVLTTGATLEACALQLLNIPGVRVSMATLAIAASP